MLYKAFDALKSIINHNITDKYHGPLNTVYKICIHVHVAVNVPALTATCFGCSAVVMRGVLDKDCCPPTASDSLWIIIIRDQQKSSNTSQSKSKAGKSYTRQAYKNNKIKDRQFLAWITYDWSVKVGREERGHFFYSREWSVIHLSELHLTEKPFSLAHHTRYHTLVKINTHNYMYTLHCMKQQDCKSSIKWRAWVEKSLRWHLTSC